jgi:hypothetical protein
VVNPCFLPSTDYGSAAVKIREIFVGAGQKTFGFQHNPQGFVVASQPFYFNREGKEGGKAPGEAGVPETHGRCFTITVPKIPKGLIFLFKPEWLTLL